MDSTRFSSLFGGSSSGSSSGTDADGGGDSERSDLGPDAAPEELLESTEYSVTGERYDIEALDHVREAGKLTKTVIPAPEDSPDERDVVAGPAIRKVVEKNYLEPQRPLAIGYSDSHGELQATGINLSDAFQHTWVTGATGSAKSTVSRAWMTTLAYAGYGFFAGFPKGSEDATALLRALPKHRLKDVRIIDPTETAHTIPMNLLDVPEFDDPTERDQEISERVNVLKAVLMQDYGSGFINVETVIEVSGRAMMASERDYSLVDMYFVLLSEDRRERFVEEVDDPLLADALGEVSDMDDDEIRPVIKRLMQWVLDPTIRRIVSHRESSLDWQEVIDDDLIVLLMLGVNNDAVKRLLTLISWRQLTAAVQRRYNETGRQIPYFAFLDEFDAVASDKLNLQSNLARARAMGLGIFVICQYPSQLPATDENNVQKALKNNARNVVALSSEDHDDAAIMSSKLRGIEAGDIVHLPDYRCWTDVPIGGGERSDALQLKTIPPMPPLRSEAEAEQVKADLLQEHGVPPPTMKEMIDGLPFADVTADELLGTTTDGDETLDFGDDMAPVIRSVVLQATYDQAYRETGDGHAEIPLATATARVGRYLEGDVGIGFAADPDDITPAQVSALLSAVPESELKRYDREDTDGLRVKCTPLGKLRFTSPAGEDLDDAVTDDGELDLSPSSTTGGESHTQLMRDFYDHALALGCRLSIHDQGGESISDASLIPDLEAYHELRSTPGLEPAEVASSMAELRDTHEIADRLTDMASAAVESESTEGTGGTAPSATFTNLSRALNEGRRCLLLARPGTAENIRERIADDPPLMRDYNEPRMSRLYNLNHDLEIDGKEVYRRPGGDSVWLYNDRTGTFELRTTGDGDEPIATFDTAEEIVGNADAYPRAGSESESEDQDGDQWTTIRAPFIPSLEFDDIEMGEAPDPAAWDVIRVPASSDDGLEVLNPDGDRTPVAELVDDAGVDRDALQEESDESETDDADGFSL